MLPSLVSETLRPMLPMAVWSPLCFAWNWHLRVTCFPCPAICIECGGKYGVTGDLLIYWLISPTPGWSVFLFVVIFAFVLVFVLVFVFVLSVAGVTGRFADLWVDCYLEVGDLGSWGGWGVAVCRLLLTRSRKPVVATKVSHCCPNLDLLTCRCVSISIWWPENFEIATNASICGHIVVFGDRPFLAGNDPALRDYQVINLCIISHCGCGTHCGSIHCCSHWATGNFW